MTVHDPDKKQVVARAAQILAAVASIGSAGGRLLDLARDTGVARPTVHRLLQELQAVGYISQLPSKRYVIGPAMFYLGLAAPSPIRNLPAIEAAAQSLSDLCGDTVYVAIRQFGAVHYIVRTEGSYPIRAQSVGVGDTIPLTASYNGLVFLAQMPAAQREEQLSRPAMHAPDRWHEVDPAEREQALREALEQLDTQGYVYRGNVVMPGVSGLAIPVPAEQGTAIAAVSISAIDSRLPEERIDELLPALRATAAEIATALKEVS